MITNLRVDLRFKLYWISCSSFYIRCMPGVGHSSRERRNSKTVPGEESSITVNSVCVDPTGDRDNPCDEAARLLVQGACWSLQEMRGSACCTTSGAADLCRLSR